MIYILDSSEIYRYWGVDMYSKKVLDRAVYTGKDYDQ